MKKIILSLLSLALMLSIVFEYVPKIDFFVYAEEKTDFRNFYLNDDKSIKATKTDGIITVTGSGTIDIQKWMEMARLIDQGAFNKKNDDKWGWQGTEEHFEITFNSSDKMGIKLCNPFDGKGGLFQNFKGLIHFNNSVGLDENLTSLHSMFCNATNANPDVSNWITDNVTDMSAMFLNTNSANPDVSKWNTSKVIFMPYLFNNAIKANPDVSNWDTSNVKDMSGMFLDATISEPDVRNWDTSKVEDMHYMFYGAKKANPDVSKWNTSNVTNMFRMFSDTENANPDVSNWDTSEVTNMSHMFHNAVKANPNVSNWKTSKVTDMSYMFFKAIKSNPDVSKWDISNVTNLSHMFFGAIKSNPDVSSWKTSKVTDMSFLFNEARNANPDVSNWDTSNVVDMSYMFNSANKADSDVSSWDTSKVMNMAHMFSETDIFDPDVDRWDTSNVTDISYMFSKTKKSNPNITNWNISNVTNMKGLFLEATNVRDLDLSKFNYDSITNEDSLENIFDGMTGLESFEIKLKFPYEFTNLSNKIYKIYERSAENGQLILVQQMLNFGDKFIIPANKRYLFTSKELYSLYLNNAFVNGGENFNYPILYPSEMRISLNAYPSVDGQSFSEWFSDNKIVFTDEKSKTSSFVMPKKNVVISPLYGSKHRLTVIDGEGSGEYYKDFKVEIKAKSNPEGKIFDKWISDNSSIRFIDLSSDSTTVIMAGEDVTIRASFKEMDNFSGETGNKDSNDKDNGSLSKTVIPESKKKQSKDNNKSIENHDFDISFTKEKKRFTDVKDSNLDHEAIYYLLEKDLIKGMDSDTFNPELKASRAMAVTIFHRLSSYDKNNEKIKSFSDVEEGKWYSESINWARKNLIVKGIGANKFNPSGKITKEQLMAIMYRYAGFKGYDTDKKTNLEEYKDYKNISKYAIDSFKWALENGISLKEDKILYPKNEISRLEMAKFFEIFLKKFEK